MPLMDHSLERVAPGGTSADSNEGVWVSVYQPGLKVASSTIDVPLAVLNRARRMVTHTSKMKM